MEDVDMSLDVYLTGAIETKTCVCPNCDHEHEYAVAGEIYWANITHNLNTMADAAGIYEHLWRPDEIGITKAQQLIEPLTQGLAAMRNHPDEFRKFDAANGWDTYDDFVPWLERYLEACREHPDADVRVSR